MSLAKICCLVFTMVPLCWTDSTPVKQNFQKFLVSIIFEDDHSCIGALIGRISVVTSHICMERFRFTSRIYKKPCRVYAGVQEDVGQDLGIWRFCIGDKTVYKKDEEDFTRLMFYAEDILNEITIDLPFDDTLVTRAKVGKPNFGSNQTCKIYGYNFDGNSTEPINQGNTTDNSSPDHSTDSTDHSIPRGTLFESSATILDQPKCEELYREYMDKELPEDFFCVYEGGISDEGRILICNDKVVGMLADNLAIIKEGNSTLYAYTHVRAESVSITSVTRSVLALIFCLTSIIWKIIL